MWIYLIKDNNERIAPVIAGIPALFQGGDAV